jgi:hypothetical protein
LFGPERVGADHNFRVLGWEMVVFGVSAYNSITVVLGMALPFAGSLSTESKRGELLVMVVLGKLRQRRDMTVTPDGRTRTARFLAENEGIFLYI